MIYTITYYYSTLNYMTILCHVTFVFFVMLQMLQ